jgi:hypothetical protein
MIGDTPYDAVAALDASVSAVGVLTRGFSKDGLVGAGCLRRKRGASGYPDVPVVHHDHLGRRSRF